MHMSEKLMLALNDVDNNQLERTREKLGYQLCERRIKRGKKHALGRILLLAAILSTLFVTTAYAAGWFGLDSLRVGPWRDYEMSSLAGTMESPEGQALQEWLAVLAEHENDPYDATEAAQLGREYTDFMAYSPETAAQLDEIVEKHGLKKVGAMETPEDEKSFYEAAGVGKLTQSSDILTNRYLGGYVYPEGSFHLEGELRTAGENYAVGYQLIRSVKGVFTMAMANVGDPENYEEWNYTSADGTVLHLARDREGHGALALLDEEEDFTVLLLGADTWADYIGDGMLDGIGDEFIELNFTREEVEKMTDAFCWTALKNTKLGMDGDFSVPEFAPTGSLLDLVDQNLDISTLPEPDQVAISTVYTAQIEPYIENFHLVDYDLDSWSDGWIAFTGEPKAALDWAAVETAAGEVYCRSVQLTRGEEGLPVPGASFDMLPYERLSCSRNVGTEEEPDYIWLGTEIKELASAELYVSQLDESFTISDTERLGKLQKMLSYEEYGDDYLHSEGWNPLYLNFADGSHALAFTAADGADAVNVFNGWQGYGLGVSLFDLFGVPLEAAGYEEHDGLVTVSADKHFGSDSFTIELDFQKNGPKLEKRWPESNGSIRWEYDEVGRLVKETNTDSEGVFSVSTYSYDENGRLLQKDVSYVRNSGWEKLIYEYDAQGRLTAEIHTDADDSPGWTGGNRYYDYDEEGNCRIRMGYQDLQP